MSDNFLERTEGAILRLEAEGLHHTAEAMRRVAVACEKTQNKRLMETTRVENSNLMRS